MTLMKHVVGADGVGQDVEMSPEEEAAIQAEWDAAAATSPVPKSITARQGKIKLLRMGLMTAEEASAGTLPAFLSAVIGEMPDEEAAELVLTWREAANWYRNDPLFGGSLLEAASTALGQPATTDAVDQFFRDASAI